MDNQNPTSASGGAHGGFAPASNTSAPYGASQAQPGEPGTAAYPDRDDTYRRIPAEYTVPEEHRRPYGDATGDFRGPGYFYSVGAFCSGLGALVLAIYAWMVVGLRSLEMSETSSRSYRSSSLDFGCRSFPDGPNSRRYRYLAGHLLRAGQ